MGHQFVTIMVFLFLFYLQLILQQRVDGDQLKVKFILIIIINDFELSMNHQDFYCNNAYVGSFHLLTFSLSLSLIRSIYI